MPYDADLVLRGQSSGAYVDLDESDVAATATAVNSDGNSVVDLGDGGGTGMDGLDVVVILHDAPTTYEDTCDIVIQDSDHLTDGWEALLSFPRIYALMREVIVTSTTAFLGTDIGLVFTATTNGAVGVLRQFSRKLLTPVGGTGKCWVSMVGAGDTYATDGDTVTCTAGTGIGTVVVPGRVIDPPYIVVRKLSTPKRYLRCSITVSAGGNFGDVDILLTGKQHSFVNNLLMTGGY